MGELHRLEIYSLILRRLIKGQGHVPNVDEILKFGIQGSHYFQTKGQGHVNSSSYRL